MLTLTLENFKRETAGKTVLALFYSEACPYCRRFLPLFRAREKDASAALAEARLEPDHPWHEAFGVRIVPTLILLRDGRVVARADGVRGVGLTVRDLERLLEEARRRAKA